MRGKLRTGRRLAAVAAGFCVCASHYAVADPAAPQPGWREIWAGADVTGHAWLIYSGATVAPYNHIYADGLRLRIAGGYGGYSYVGERRGQLASFEAETAYAEALVGYLQRFGPLTAKAFLGVAAIE